VVLETLYRLPLPVAGMSLVLKLLLLASVLGMVALSLADKIIGFLPKWPLFRIIAEFSADARRAFWTLKGAQSLLLCVIAHLNFGLASLWLGKALGLPLSFVDYTFTVSLVTLVATLPLSIGGWGVREGATVVLFASLGVAAHAAVTFSVISGLTVVLASLGGLPLVWMSHAARSDAAGAEGLIGLARKDSHLQST
jgi:hypothetical protein